MADKIKLTPSELQAQASEMRVLKQEYESLFASVTSELGNINRNWSAKLANNFRGKIVGAQKTFSQLTEDLMNGAKVADTCAVTFESVDSQLAKMYGGNIKTKGSGIVDSEPSHVADTNVHSDKKKKKESWLEKMGNAVVKKTKKAVKYVKDNYKDHGWIYKTVQYGKCALKGAKAVVKIAGAVGEIASGVGIPIAIATIISAGNDLVNMATDAAYVATGQYGEVGQHNALKNLLVKNGGQIGEMLGNKGLGELVGKATYIGLDATLFLNSGKKMLESYGKVNTLLTGKTGQSFFFGETRFSDVLDNKLKLTNVKDFAKHILKIDANSTANFIIDAAHNTVSSLKGAFSLGKAFVDAIF